MSNFHRGDLVVHKDHSRLRGQVLFTFNDAITDEPRIDVRWMDNHRTDNNLGLLAADYMSMAVFSQERA